MVVKAASRTRNVCFSLLSLSSFSLLLFLPFRIRHTHTHTTTTHPEILAAATLPGTRYSCSDRIVVYHWYHQWNVVVLAKMSHHHLSGSTRAIILFSLSRYIYSNALRSGERESKSETIEESMKFCSREECGCYVCLWFLKNDHVVSLVPNSMATIKIKNNQTIKNGTVIFYVLYSHTKSRPGMIGSTTTREEIQSEALISLLLNPHAHTLAHSRTHAHMVALLFDMISTRYI